MFFTMLFAALLALITVWFITAEFYSDWKIRKAKEDAEYQAWLRQRGM